jgi:hypothetical protein
VVVRESWAVVSGAEIEERVSQSKQRTAGLDDKCRVLSSVAMGKSTIQASNLN